VNYFKARKRYLLPKPIIRHSFEFSFTFASR